MSDLLGTPCFNVLCLAADAPRLETLLKGHQAHIYPEGFLFALYSTMVTRLLH